MAIRQYQTDTWEPSIALILMIKIAYSNKILRLQILYLPKYCLLYRTILCLDWAVLSPDWNTTEDLWTTEMEGT